MLDLFSGLGGASQAMKERGWHVVSVELNPKLKPDVVADVRYLPLKPYPLDLLWASPPCTEYSREDQPWTRKGIKLSTELWEAAQAVISSWEPRYWVIENVRGAQKVHGRATYHFGSRYLWSNLPMLGQCGLLPQKQALWPSPDRYWLRSKVEYQVSEAVASAVEAFANG